MASEIQQLIYQVEGEAKLRAATSDLEKQRAAMDKVIAAKSAYASNQAYEQALDAEARKLKPLIDRVDDLGRAFGSRSGKAGLARDAMDASRALQDFAQGGLAGILNNLESLGRAASRFMPGVTAFFGGPAGLAAAATTAGVAIWALQDPVKALVSWITSEGNGIPKATDAVGRLEERLGEIKERLKEVKEAWDGSAASVAEVNRLTEEQIGVEKRLAQAKAERAAVDAQRDKENAPDKDVTKAVSDAIKVGGGVDKTTSDLAAAMPGASGAARAQLDQVAKERDAAAKAAGSNPSAVASVRKRFARQIADAQATLDKALQDAQAEAAGLMGRALQGDAAAIRRLGAALPGRGFDQIGATAAMPGAVKGILEGVGKGAWEEQFRGGRMAADAAKLEKAGEATAAGMLGGFEAGARIENRQGAEMEKALAPYREADVGEWMKGLDRAERGGFSEDEADAAAAASSVVGRAGKEFRQTGRVDRIAPAEVERALSEAQGALNMQMTSDAPDMRIIETLSSLSSQLVQVKQQLANQAQQAQAMSGRMSGLMGGGGMPVMQPNIWGAW